MLPFGTPPNFRPKSAAIRKDHSVENDSARSISAAGKIAEFGLPFVVAKTENRYLPWI